MTTYRIHNAFSGHIPGDYEGTDDGQDLVIRHALTAAEVSR